MPIISSINQYLGFNAHYQSVAQNQKRGWKSFHGTYITDLTRHIQNRLPPNYRVEPTDSLQIQLEDETTHTPEPDLAIYKQKDQPTRSSPAMGNTAIAMPYATKASQEILSEEENQLSAILISRKNLPTGDLIPITRIEIISDSNKLEEKAIYRRNRAEAIATGTNVVDVDLLHQTASPIREVPNYRKGEPNAYPYNITVSEGKGIGEEKTYFYGFHVDQPVLPIQIPLAGTDQVLIHFGEAYNYTFNNTLVFSEKVNYAQEPDFFDSYSRFDQQRIWGRMVACVDAAYHESRDERVITLTGQLLQVDLNDAALLMIRDKPYRKAMLIVDEEQLTCWWLLHTLDELSLLQRIKVDETITVMTTSITKGSRQALDKIYEELRLEFQHKGVQSFLKRAKNG